MTLQASAGQALVIELLARPGAGVVWQAPPAPPGCRLQEIDAATDSAAGMGGASRQRFVLTCDSAGQYALSFTYKRPWESEVRALQPVQVMVR